MASTCRAVRLRLVVFDKVPWPKPTILHKARRARFGKSYDDMLTRLRLKQAFGRLIRSRADKGCFVILESATPSRLLTAFPPETPVTRCGLAEAIGEIRGFLARAICVNLGHGRVVRSRTSHAAGAHALGARPMRASTIAEIVEDAIAAFDPDRLWRSHPQDAPVGDGVAGGCLAGAAGVIWALDHLKREGAADYACDFRPGAAGARRRATISGSRTCRSAPMRRC